MKIAITVITVAMTKIVTWISQERITKTAIIACLPNIPRDVLTVPSCIIQSIVMKRLAAMIVTRLFTDNIWRVATIALFLLI